MKSEFDKMLSDGVWPKHLSPDEWYSRLHDDHDGEFTGRISVAFDRMGDARLQFDSHPALRFRTTNGGTNSPRVNTALRILAEAIRLDSLERPEPKQP